MKLEIQISNVVAETQGCYFVAVQLDYKDTTTPPQKMRTQLAPPTNRPNFKRNLFTFPTVIEQQTLKFGLMACPDSSENSINKGRPIGIASLSIALARLKELPPAGESKIVHFFNKSKEVGQLQCKIMFSTLVNSKPLKLSKVQGVQGIIDKLEFNPLISRVLFSQEVAKDQMRMQNSIEQLQRQAQGLYDAFKRLKGEEQTLERLYSDLLKDSQQIKNEIEMTEKINEKIAMKLNQREGLEALKLEIDMLRNSDQGKGLLLEKLEYFEERIKMEELEHQRLADKYQNIKHIIKARIEKAENYAKKLKGKELQEFQLSRNRQILKKYEDIQYEFNCNQHVIEKLVSNTKKSELSGQQAALILSQVNFKIKMEEVSSGFQQEEQMLKLIEKQAGSIHKHDHKQLSEQQKVVLGIKLTALEEEILEVRNKIKQALGRKNMQQSTVTRF